MKLDLGATLILIALTTPQLAAANVRTGTVRVNETALYYEVRGSGPVLLMISGATGDAGHFARVAPLLAETYTVVTYDRRGNSRSPATEQTSLEQQADDAAELLRSLRLSPATVFGTSGGAIIALKLALRRPEVCRSVIVHEPPLLAVLPNAAEAGKQFQLAVESALKERGPKGAMEMFIRTNAGDAAFDGIERELRERMLGNGERFFTIELPMFLSWIPSEAELRTALVPIRVVAGSDNRGTDYYAASDWLAQRLGTKLGELPGRHVPYFTDPAAMALALKARIDLLELPPAEQGRAEAGE
jgi:pimeloyl-ACP methyl ester carboxylesterase